MRRKVTKILNVSSVLYIFCVFLQKNADRLELKVWGDLAMAFAGNSPMEVVKVDCFYNAMVGFAPLLFDLRSTSNIGDVAEKLQEVWEYKNRDANLLNNWVRLLSFYRNN